MFNKGHFKIKEIFDKQLKSNKVEGVEDGCNYVLNDKNSMRFDVQIQALILCPIKEQGSGF